MKRREEIKLIAQKLANLELAYQKFKKPEILKNMWDLIDTISIEDLDYLDQEIQKILKVKID